MNTDDLEYFHEILTQSLKDLLTKGDRTVTTLLETAVNSSDLLDQATNEADRSLRLRMHDREIRLIRKINKSLDRLKEGTFGVCEMCGEDIALKRLKARPVTTYCITCKNRMEAKERAANG